MKPIRISRLAEIAQRYDAFLIDQYGVLHDGENLYPGVADTIAELTAAGKSVVVMTNSGKRSEANRRRLAKMGLKLSPSQVVSSGEVAFDAIASDKLDIPFSRGAAACIIGKRGDDYGFDGLDLSFVMEPDQADFLLILGSDAPATSLDGYRHYLAAAAERHIPALCCNPDLQMLTAGGFQPAPGAIASVYVELGVAVTYIGKPYPAIYDYAIAIAGHPARQRTLAIGDSIAHDIFGGSRAGLATALVSTGLSLNLDDDEIDQQSQTSGCAPDWILPSLRWR